MESFNREELIAGLRTIGVEKGDVIFLQSRLHGLGLPVGVKGKSEVCDFFIDSFREVVSDEGTIVVPTFTTQVARHDEPFIIEETVPNYGVLPEYVFNHPDFTRSPHPLVSVAASGKLADVICHSGGASGYGERSPFDMMAKLGARNVFLGLEIIDAVTMVHYMEMHYGVPYVYNKLLKWRPIKNGVPSTVPQLATVRYLEYETTYNLTWFQDYLYEHNMVAEAKIGGGVVSAVTMKDMLKAGYDNFDRDPYCFLKKPPPFIYGKIPYDGPTFERESSTKDGVDENLPARIAAAAPAFSRITTLLFDSVSPSQKKSIVNFISGGDLFFLRECEDICSAISKSMEKLGVPIEQLPGFYNAFCMDTLKEQIEFRKSGEYKIKDYEDAFNEIYNNSEVMRYYMYGLMLSQILWENHWKLLNFARSDFFAPFSSLSDLHVEVGPGHGWFTLTALRFGASKAIAFDISEQSALLTRTLLETQGIQRDRWDIRIQDVQNKIPLEDESVDTFMAGEVLEHIPAPAKFIAEAFRILKKGGAAYLTTAVNAPAIDHMFLFNTSDEIRTMIREAGFHIESEIEIEAGRIGDKPLINYGSVVRKL